MNIKLSIYEYNSNKFNKKMIDRYQSGITQLI